jgi:multidrug efflux pump subunit AcrA (membrane-fusion protein)
MFGNMVIEAAPRPNVLAIPTEAVIRSGRRTIAVVSLGEGRFEPRDVELGLDSGEGWYEVRSGLDDGDEIVVSGQFLIDSESNLREAMNKLLAAGQAAPLPSADASGHSMPSTPSTDGR